MFYYLIIILSYTAYTSILTHGEWFENENGVIFFIDCGAATLGDITAVL